MRIVLKRSAAVLAGLLLIVTGSWYAAGQAWAGGPTSVLIVSPGTGEATGLHTNGARYQRLVDAVGAYQAPAGPTDSPASVMQDCSDCQIRLTWMIHDMTVWRIDRVYLTADDGLWLQSVSTEAGGGNLLDRPAHWQRPSDPEALLALLRESGVLSQPAEASNGSVATDQAAAPIAGTPAAPLGLTALGSGILGVAIGLTGGRLVRRRHSAADRVVLSG